MKLLARPLMIRFFLLSSLLLSLGCASTRVQLTKDDLRARRATITSFTGVHSSGGVSFGLIGAAVGAVAAASQNPGIGSRTYLVGLNRKCLDAMETVLAANKDLPYSPRSTVDLRNKSGITAPITVKLLFGHSTGWKKPMVLVVNWQVVSPSGQVEFAADTRSTADSADEVFPDTRDPRYESTFVELAKQNAIQFLEMLEAQSTCGGATECPGARANPDRNATPCGASNESYLRSEVVPLAQTDFHCPRDQIATRYLDTKCYRAEATGCGYTRQYSYGDSGWVGTADVSQVGGAQTPPYIGPAAPGPRPVPFER